MRRVCGIWVVATAAIGASTGALMAQEAGGLSATLDLTQGFESIDDEGYGAASSAGFRGLTTLDFGLRSVTRTQRLSFGLSSSLATLLEDGDFRSEETVSSLEYARNSRNSELTLGARYRSGDVDDLAFFFPTFEDDDIVTGIGRREVTTLESSLVLGRETRVTGTLSARYENSNFFDSVDPTLTDTETGTVEGRVAFRLTQTMTLDVFGLRREIDETGPGAVDRTGTEIGTELTYAISPITTVSGQIVFVEDETRDIVTEQTDGWNYALSATRALSNGELSLAYTQEDTASGPLRQLVAGQERTLARGALGYSLGVNAADGFDPQLIASISLEYELDPNAAVSFALSQEGTLNGDDQEVVNSQLEGSFVRQLSPLSELTFSFALVDEDVLDPAGTDQRTTRFDLAFDYALNRDWSLTSGIGHTSVNVDGADDRTETTISLGLQRSFAYR